jgi:hypothetical protein
MSFNVVEFVSLSSVRGFVVSVAAGWVRGARGLGLPLRRSLVVVAAVGWAAAFCPPVTAAPGGEVGRGSGAGVERPVGSVEAGRCVAVRVGRLGDPEDYTLIAEQSDPGKTYLSALPCPGTSRLGPGSKVGLCGDPEGIDPGRPRTGHEPTLGGFVRISGDPEDFNVLSSSRGVMNVWSQLLLWFSFPR